MSKILPELFAFAMAAVRLMPSGHRMVTYMNELAFYEPTIDRLGEHFPYTSSGKIKHADFS